MERTTVEGYSQIGRHTHTYVERDRDRELELYALVLGWMAAWEEKAPKLA
jgi:hypothetical protein